MTVTSSFPFFVRSFTHRLPGRCLVAALAATPLAASADAVSEFPTRPIRLVYAWSAGAGDAAARAVADGIAAELKQPVVLEYKPGGSTIIAATAVARSPADGYTLLYGSTTTFSINPSTYRQLPYDPIKDFAPVSRVIQSPFFVFSSPKLPVKTLADFIALAKSRPGQLSYSTPGIGSVPHLSIERLSLQTGIKLVHVPYKGSGQLISDVAAGHVDFSFDTNAFEFVKAGRVHGLAVSGTAPSAALPSLPTVAQAGVPGYSSAVWFGIVAPAGTPDGIVAKLNGAIRKTLSKPALIEQFAAQGIELSPTTAQAFASQIRDETPVWRQVVEDARIEKVNGS